MSSCLVLAVFTSLYQPGALPSSVLMLLGADWGSPVMPAQDGIKTLSCFFPDEGWRGRKAGGHRHAPEGHPGATRDPCQRAGGTALPLFPGRQEWTSESLLDCDRDEAGRTRASLWGLGTHILLNLPAPRTASLCPGEALRTSGELRDVVVLSQREELGEQVQR